MNPGGFAAVELQHYAGDPVVYLGFLICVTDFSCNGKRVMIIRERGRVVAGLLFCVGYSTKSAGLLI
jgi:hypothetical protein